MLPTTHLLRVFGLALLIAATSKASAEETFILLPAKVKLTGRAAHQELLVERIGEKGFSGQLTNGVTLTSSDTNIVRIEGAVVLPVANGTASVTAQSGNFLTTAQITVEQMERSLESTFRNHVQPVLAKMGCNAGACHGAAAGQNGLKLSLRGYDDEGDFLALTRHAMGRRIIPSDPGRSLMLLKPTAAVPHKGGKKFETDSLEYKILSDWIAAGTPGPKASDPRIERIEVLPERIVLAPGSSQQLNVRATFNDGHSEDVTRWVKYTAANASVAIAEDNGMVKVTGYGEGAITAWYLSRIAIATISVPYSNSVPAEIFAQAGNRSFIDELVTEKLQSLNLPPSRSCTDGEFIRRLFLDSMGILPSAKEARDFLASTSPKKRDELIESVFKRPEFVDYWTYKWSDLLLVSSKKLKPAAMWSYYNWIHDNVAANTPWDTFARKLVTAQGSTLENGAANYFVLHEDPRDMSETTSQAFLGMSINCAKCHNHPMEKWTNDQYYQMANLFARVRLKSGSAEGDNVVFAATAGDLVQPLRGKPQIPAPLDGKPLAMDDTSDRRQKLSDWLVSRDNPYFGRAVVNRVWANCFGVGLVENVDDLRVTNPASNEKLLSALANYLADEKYDLRALMRAILQSATYQRSSEPVAGNATDQRFYSRYYPRRLMAEVLLDSLSQATGAPTEFKGYPSTWRAVQLPDSNVDSYFLKSFGRPERDKTCECERTANPSVTQMLHISNGDTLNKKLGAKGNRIEKWMEAKLEPEKLVEEVYLTAFSRFPKEEEKGKLVAIVKSVKEEERRAVVEDVFWALLSSKEFLFNH